MEYSLKDVPLYPAAFGSVFGDLSGKGIALPAGAAQDAMFIIFVVFLIFYCSVSGVLFYHWHTYGMKNKMIITAQALFMAVSLILFWIALVLITRT